MKKFLTEKYSIGFIIFGFIVLVVGIISFIIFQTLNIKSETFNVENFSQFGGFIGGVVGSLWSLAGFILFYIALNKQKEDLEINREALKSQIEAMQLQTEEFKAQKEELEETRKVYIEQGKTQSLQRFENTFFNMLSLHHKIVEGIDLDYKFFLFSNIEYAGFLDSYNPELKVATSDYKNRDVFKKTYEHLYYLIKLDYNKNVRKVELVTIKNLERQIDIFNILKFEIAKKNIDNTEFHSFFDSIYEFIYEKVNTDFGHYFRNLYRLIRMIDEHVFDENSVQRDFEKKYYYTSIVRAQLSDYEIFWLFFNCIFEYGEKFKPLIEKYAFIKILGETNDEVLIHYKKIYNKTAFELEK